MSINIEHSVPTWADIYTQNSTLPLTNRLISTTIRVPGRPRTRAQMYGVLHELGHVGHNNFDNKGILQQEFEASLTALKAIKPKYQYEALKQYILALKTYMYRTHTTEFKEAYNEVVALVNDPNEREWDEKLKPQTMRFPLYSHD